VLKKAENERRAGIKEEAKHLYDAAKEKGDVEDMKKYSMRTSKLTKEMIGEAKELLSALGIPVVQAPSEGEAQAAYMARQGDVFAEISQDYDCLLFGVPRTISERKKMKDKLSYERVLPQMIELEPNLKHLEIDQDQLIALGILVGTDYDIGGVKGIGPRKALDLIRQHGNDFDRLFETAKWNEHFDYSWKEVFNLFKEMPIEKNYNLVWKEIDRDKVVEVLCDKHDFSRQRAADTLDNLGKAQLKLAQKGLGDFF